MVYIVSRWGRSVAVIDTEVNKVLIMIGIGGGGGGDRDMEIERRVYYR
jgi:hypothetical protein